MRILYYALQSVSIPIRVYVYVRHTLIHGHHVLRMSACLYENFIEELGNQDEQLIPKLDA